MLPVCPVEPPPVSHWWLPYYLYDCLELWQLVLDSQHLQQCNQLHKGSHKDSGKFGKSLVKWLF
jgi:hypothetical protein